MWPELARAITSAVVSLRPEREIERERDVSEGGELGEPPESSSAGGSDGIE